MTTTLEIISDALRESNQIALGQTPTELQQTEGLRLLNRLISSVYGYDVGENLVDWPIGIAGIEEALDPQAWQEQTWKYPEINSRLLLSNTTPQTVYMPVQPYNGSRIQAVDVNGDLATYPVTLDGNGRRFNIGGVISTTLVLSTNDVNRTFVYRDDVAQWHEIDGLAIDSDIPFPLVFDDYWTIKLASRLNPRYGRMLSPESLMRLQEMKEQLEQRYRQKKEKNAPLAVQRLHTPNRYSQYNDTYGRGGPRGWMRP